MGFGDEIMATALARKTVEALAEEGQHVKCVFGDPKNFMGPDGRLRVNWSEVFENNPHILQQGEPTDAIVCIPDFPGSRFYISYGESDIENGAITRFHWDEDFTALPGDFFFTPEEKSAASEVAIRLARDFVVVEPSVAEKPWMTKKAWPWDNWQALVTALDAEGVEVVQFRGDAMTPTLMDATPIDTPTFRSACGVLACAGAFIGTDGGLHHASAALGVPGVVLWGHFTSPERLGYEIHNNLRVATGNGCGKTTQECEECIPAMHAITVESVFEATMELVRSGVMASPRTLTDTAASFREAPSKYFGEFS